MNNSNNRIAGVYGIVDTGVLSPEKMLGAAVAALDGGVRVIQYRDKGSDQRRRLQQARALAVICNDRNCCFIVNDDVALALAVAADGVHIGAQDMSIGNARLQLGSSAIIGASCYNSLGQAQDAVAAGADYVAFGSFYTSVIKPDAVCAKPVLLTRARASIAVPIVAIGGINATNGDALVTAGADALAVISGLFATEDIYQAAISLNQLFY